MNALPPSARTVVLTKTAGLDSASIPLASRVRSEPGATLAPHVLTRQAEKTLQAVVGLQVEDEMLGSVQPPPMQVILSGVDAMVERMGGHRLNAEQVAAIKLGVDKAFGGTHPDIARRCKEAIDRGAGVEFQAQDVTDLTQLHPSALTAKAKGLAAIVGHTEGVMTRRAVRELFDGLDDVHTAVKKQTVSAGYRKDIEASKQAQAAVEACILDTAQALRESNQSNAATRSPEQMKMLRNTVIESINDEALAQKCSAIFDAEPPQTTEPSS